MSILATVPQHKQKDVFGTAVDAASSHSEIEAQTTIGSECASLDAIYGTARLLFLVANEWKLNEVANANRSRAFFGVASRAISALALGDRLSPEVRATALAPFATLDAFLAPTSAAPNVAPCLMPDSAARPINSVTPTYQTARFAHPASGIVYVSIALNDNGDVRSAGLSSDTLYKGEGYEGHASRGDSLGGRINVHCGNKTAGALRRHISSLSNSLSKSSPLGRSMVFRRRDR